MPHAGAIASSCFFMLELLYLELELPIAGSGRNELVDVYGEEPFLHIEQDK